MQRRRSRNGPQRSRRRPRACYLERVIGPKRISAGSALGDRQAASLNGLPRAAERVRRGSCRRLRRVSSAAHVRDHRRGRRPAARAHRNPRTAPAPAVLHAPDDRHLPQCRDRVRRRQSAVVRSRLRPDDPLGVADRVAGARRRRHADRRGRGHRGRARARGVDEGRSVARRARVLQRRARASGGRRCSRCGARSAATRSLPRSTSRASSPSARSTSGPRRCSATKPAHCSPASTA